LTQATHVLRADCVNAARSRDHHCHRDARFECGATSHSSIPSARHRIPALGRPGSSASMPQPSAYC
jgi:hypothetical protein